ncbi:MAG: DUF2500 domain-containing protein [Bacillota bacterium]|jgi:hypothetical protein|nr:DUF2500 domain-containing protein [Bacillota bacterium]NLL26046.1 DUF2500 domain-containing protein [Erysipelotrichia bacterium]
MSEAVFLFASVFIIGVFIYSVYSLISQKIKDDRSPVLRAKATVVAKRVEVSTSSNIHHHGTGNIHHNHISTSTSYYVTFELDSGERKEFSVYGDEYGLLVEKDYGYLTYQGSRFKGFEIMS